MDLFIVGVNSEISFGPVNDVEQGRERWAGIAQWQTLGGDVIGFELRDEGRVVYRGNFVTDEC